MQSFEDEIKQMIIDVLQLEDITPLDIDSDAPLFVEGLARRCHPETLQHHTVGEL